MIAPDKMDGVGVEELKGIKDENHFAGVAATINVVAQEKVVRMGRITESLKDPQEGVDVPVDIADHDDGAVECDERRLPLEDLRDGVDEEGQIAGNQQSPFLEILRDAARDNLPKNIQNTPRIPARQVRNAMPHHINTGDSDAGKVGNHRTPESRLTMKILGLKTFLR
jgi:hypothetical protein